MVRVVDEMKYKYCRRFVVIILTFELVPRLKIPHSRRKE